MANIVKLDNKINDLKLGKLNEDDMKIFLSTLFKMQDKGLEEVEISFSEIKELADIKKYSFSKIGIYLDNLSDKLIGLNKKIKTEEGKIINFNIFDSTTIDPIAKTFTVKSSKTFEPLITNVNDNFSYYNLSEFIKVKGKYSKLIYQILKQFRSTNMYLVNVDDLREKLSVPSCYNTSALLMQKVVNPSIKELGKVFHNLKLEKIKKGKRIVKLKFTWAKKERVYKKIKKDPIEAEREEAEIKAKKRIERTKEDLKKTLERNTGAKEEVTYESYEDYLSKNGLEDSKSNKLSYKVISRRTK